MKIREKISSILLPLITLLLLLSCEDDIPFSGITNPYDYMQDKTENADTVKINSIEAKGADIETASIFTIYGENFQTDSLPNIRVFFNSVESEVISATPTELEVYRPNLSGDSIFVKVACHDRINVAKLGPISLPEVVTSFGNFVGSEDIKEITIDSNDNLFAFMSGQKKIIKFELPVHARTDWTGNLEGGQGYYAPVEMKVGPAGVITYAPNINVILRCGSDGSVYDNQRIDLLDSGVKAREFDYAQNDNIYAGGIDDGIILADNQGEITTFSLYQGYRIEALRIFEGYIYVIAKPMPGESGQYGIYKNEIMDDGSVAESELVLDWQATDYNEYEINDLTFSSGGQIYIGTDHPRAALLQYNLSENTIAPIYYGIIDSPVDELEWGNDEYLYALINKASTVSNGNQIVKINMGREGAPYYGRE